jgi:glycosyltransferase involved in cell wall biosynthesis
MKNVLYIGNALSKSKGTPTVIETLSAHLKAFCNVKVVSNQPNQVLRLLDMIRLVFNYRSQTDLVLIDTYSTLNFYYALIISQLCRVFRIPYICILHGGDLENRLKKSPKLCRLLFHNAQTIVAPSPFLKSVFERYGYAELLYIPNSIELQNYEFTDRPIDGINLLWVRSFSSLYNPEQAVLVLEALLHMNYDATLTMIGPEVDGSLAKTKALAEEKGLKVNFTGKLSKAEWLAYSKDCTIFINTTDVDNTPVSVIEAMAIGLPVVSTNVGGLPYLISDGHDGILVPPRDVKAMVAAIINLKTDDSLRLKLVTTARAKVENFSWDAVRPQWEALLS